MRIGTITGLFDQKSDCRISSVAGLSYEIVKPHDEQWLNAIRVCGYWLSSGLPRLKVTADLKKAYFSFQQILKAARGHFDL